MINIGSHTQNREGLRAGVKPFAGRRQIESRQLRFRDIGRHQVIDLLQASLNLGFEVLLVHADGDDFDGVGRAHRIARNHYLTRLVAAAQQD